ncbi:hypothetical protein D3C71_1404960 [compost metagenome]
MLQLGIEQALLGFNVRLSIHLVSDVLGNVLDDVAAFTGCAGVVAIPAHITVCILFAVYASALGIQLRNNVGVNLCSKPCSRVLVSFHRDDLAFDFDDILMAPVTRCNEDLLTIFVHEAGLVEVHQAGCVATHTLYFVVHFSFLFGINDERTTMIRGDAANLYRDTALEGCFDHVAFAAGINTNDLHGAIIALGLVVVADSLVQVPDCFVMRDRRLEGCQIRVITLHPATRECSLALGVTVARQVAALALAEPVPAAMCAVPGCTPFVELWIHIDAVIFQLIAFCVLEFCDPQVFAIFHVIASRIACVCSHTRLPCTYPRSSHG